MWKSISGLQWLIPKSNNACVVLFKQQIGELSSAAHIHLLLISPPPQAEWVIPTKLLKKLHAVPNWKIKTRGSSVGQVPPVPTKTRVQIASMDVKAWQGDTRAKRGGIGGSSAHLPSNLTTRWALGSVTLAQKITWRATDEDTQHQLTDLNTHTRRQYCWRSK